MCFCSFVRIFPPPDYCSLHKDVGPCRTYYPFWYFDSGAKACQPFTYGGCLGNQNRFSTKEECLRICGNGMVRETGETLALIMTSPHEYALSLSLVPGLLISWRHLHSVSTSLLSILFHGVTSRDRDVTGVLSSIPCHFLTHLFITSFECASECYVIALFHYVTSFVFSTSYGLHCTAMSMFLHITASFHPITSFCTRRKFRNDVTALCHLTCIIHLFYLILVMPNRWKSLKFLFSRSYY